MVAVDGCRVRACKCCVPSVPVQRGGRREERGVSARSF
jgi:hypothetical protein